MKTFLAVAMCASALYLAGCSAAARFTGAGPASSPVSPSTFHGKVLLTIQGVASYYSEGFNGKETASGEIFDKNALTAAHREFPFGTLLRVTNLSNNKNVEVVVNDRGPVDRSRIIDLSEAAARDIGMIKDGTVLVRIQVLKWGNNDK
ncbi:MAG: septal ring lytic transglycosylase RlpA family protein [Bacteroidetes bacterium]|nr:septal ring lytic transglycosylase RlpA family protein [Bacteroidota bacterium]